MNSVSELCDSSQYLHGLIAATTNGSIDKADPVHAELKSFQLVFKQIKKTPELLRIMLQNEFLFTGVIDVFSKNAPKKPEELLVPDWYSSNFVIPSSADLPRWLSKCIHERRKGNTSVILLPCRTNTKWFTRLVMCAADELRFIEGRLTMPGFKTQTPFPDCLAIFKGGEKDRTFKKGSVAGVGIFSCKTAFSDDQTTFTNKHDEKEEDDDEEEEEEDDDDTLMV